MIIALTVLDSDEIDEASTAVNELVLPALRRPGT
jgi:hypothetical protein